jgi:hypothetical protein
MNNPSRKITVPKFLRELHGERISLYTFFSVYVTAIITASFLTYEIIKDNELSYWKYILFFIIVIDIAGGVVANLSSSTNQYYQQNEKKRIPFILIHILQPTILYVIFPQYLNYFLFIALFTVILTLIVSAISNREIQQNTASAFLVIGIIFATMFNEINFYVLALGIMFMIKLILGFSVRRPDFEK